jgi:diadenylate cyclase
MSWTEFVQFLGWRDLVDLVALTVIIYSLLKLIRGTRAVQVVIGILILIAIWYIAQVLDLRGVGMLLQGFLIILPVAIIVLFQQQIRRALASFGRSPLFSFLQQEQVESSFQEIVLAATAMARRSIGGLIVFERGEGLRDYAENGIPLDALISFDLLLTIFDPSTPLHDGAAIVQGDRIVSAACFLPLSTNPELTTRFGTRHRAAIGVTEETDALAIVISEERGMISIAVGGELIEDLDPRSLRNMLYHYLSSDEQPMGAAA